MCVCVHARARVCVRACVVSVIVKRPVLPPSVVDGCPRNPLYYYYYYYYYEGVHVDDITPEHNNYEYISKRKPNYQQCA